jgi:hypothetical protein
MQLRKRHERRLFSLIYRETHAQIYRGNEIYHENEIVYEFF